MEFVVTADDHHTPLYRRIRVMAISNTESIFWIKMTWLATTPAIIIKRMGSIVNTGIRPTTHSCRIIVSVIYGMGSLNEGNDSLINNTLCFNINDGIWNSFEWSLRTVITCRIIALTILMRGFICKMNMRMVCNNTCCFEGVGIDSECDYNGNNTFEENFCSNNTIDGIDLWELNDWVYNNTCAFNSNDGIERTRGDDANNYLVENNCSYNVNRRYPY